MIDGLDALRYGRLSVPTIWIALAVSLLVHLALLWVWPRELHWLSLENAERGNASGPLVVELARAPQEETVTAPTAPAALPASAHRRRASRTDRMAVPEPVRAPLTPPVIALEPRPVVPVAPTPVIEPAPTPVQAVEPTPAPVVEPTPARAPLTVPPPVKVPVAAPPSPPPAVASAVPAPVLGDLSSYIVARRRARGQAPFEEPRHSPPQESPPRTASAEEEAERRSRVIAANLGLQRTPTVGYDPRAGGGIFEIQRMSYDAAEFIFYGWNKEIRRNSKQLIEVERGGNSDIRIAVVRRMIAIIRDAETGDFMWASQRLGRNVVLSARLADDAELQAFLQEEFFGDPRLPRSR